MTDIESVQEIAFKLITGELSREMKGMHHICSKCNTFSLNLNVSNIIADVESVEAAAATRSGSKSGSKSKSSSSSSSSEEEMFVLHPDYLVDVDVFIGIAKELVVFGCIEVTIMAIIFPYMCL